MTKEQFLENTIWTNKIIATLLDMRRQKSRKMNMFEYINFMQEFNVNGGKKLARWILTDNNYSDFLETLKEKWKNFLRDKLNLEWKQALKNIKKLMAILFTLTQLAQRCRISLISWVGKHHNTMW